MSPPEPDLERLLREACPPVEPSAATARAIGRLVSGPPFALRLARLALPYAAGVLTVLGVQQFSRGSSPPALGVERPALEAIADRVPPPPAPPPSTPEPPVPPAAPVPRIS